MVDAAVFLLNDRHLLTRKKMFDVLDKFDLGCGPGGGRDSSDVFMTSGLSLVSSGLTTTARDKLTCDGALGRQRREADSPRPGKVTQRQICCSDGAKVLNGSMCFTEATAHKNATRACRQEFFRCCRRRAKCMAGNCRPEGRSSGGIDDIMNMDIDESEELTPRSNFKESTLLQSYVIGQSGKKSVHVTLPSSITKWMVQGVTISPTSGMCIANPYNITVFKEFYIDVRIPLKAVRGEQLEVKVTIYNFQRIDTKVKVYMYGVKGLCSEALPGEKSSPRFLRILRNDAATTSFPILPLELGQYPIKVVAYTTIGSDAVQKTLLVVPEGKRITVPAKSIVLDPQGVLAGKGLPDRNRRNAKLNAKPVKEEIDVTVPANIIKGTESCTASITGNIVGHSVEASIKGVSDMLAIPRGCGEQTMIRMAPTVYAMSYLSQTSPDLKGIEAKGHQLIQQGYTRQLTFRKSDGSFAVWSKRPSSTWLTAFVLKVFCQAQEFVNIDQKVISSGLAWLQTTQRQDGRFKEKYRVHHQEMIGGVKEDVSLTAFVLITLRECHAGQPGNAPGELEAIRFLEGQLERIKDLYTKAIVTYALSLTSSEKTQRANELLRQGAVYNKAKSIRYWPAGGENSALAVEATSYALMAQLELRDQKYTHAIVNWLTQKRNSKGAFKSTQDTVVGLQAITKYSIETFVEEIDLECSLASEANAEFNEKVKITKEDALVQRRVKRVPIGGKLIVETKGTGVGQLQVDISYNVPTKKDELCKFELIVDCTDVKFVVDGDRENCDVCGECEEKDDGFVDYDYDLLIIPGARSARGNKEHAASSPRRSRIGRQAARIGGAVRKQPRNNAEGGVSKTVVCINIRVSSLTGTDTGMSIIDVGLFTGFSPFKGDLDQLKTSNTIDSYEINDGRVILYLPKIPKKDPAAEPLSVKFRARQDLRVGNIQPASVKVFYYYEPDEVSCTEFYRPDDKSPVYETICIGDACKCAEGHCPKCYEEKEKLALTRNDLMSIACNDVDYVYEVKVTEMKEDVKAMGLLQRRISVDLQEILKPGSDRLAVEGSHIDLWITLSCGHCPLMEEGKKYLVMARDGPVENGRRKYALDESAFVMEFYDRADRRLAMPVRRLGNQMILFKRAIGTGCAK